MTKRYLVVYEAGPNNYSGFAPDVPGCVSTGSNLEDMRQHMREALDLHFEGISLSGETLPEPVTTAVDFAQERPEDGVTHCIVEWIDIEIPSQERQPHDIPVSA